MKKLLLKYVLEFIVIVVGISLSFYAEKQNALQYKNELKNQSLNRILKNLEVDNQDYIFNITAHKDAIYGANWIIKNKDLLDQKSKDSIGYNLSRALMINTVFIDNQEEYRGLQNSGLIELIENEELVRMLQNKYTFHTFIKFIEELISDNQKEHLMTFLYENSISKSDRANKLGYFLDRLYTGPKKIPQHLIERMVVKKHNHLFYINYVKRRVRNDSILISLIHKEIEVQ
jgi:hypothetical protein